MTDLFIARVAVAVGLGVVVSIIAALAVTVGLDEIDPGDAIGGGFGLCILGGFGGAVLAFVILHAIDFVWRGQ